MIGEGSLPTTPALVDVYSDIGEHRRAERELARLAQAVEHGADAIVSNDRELRICHWNAGAELMYGYSAQKRCPA